MFIIVHTFRIVCLSVLIFEPPCLLLCSGVTTCCNHWGGIMYVSIDHKYGGTIYTTIFLTMLAYQDALNETSCDITMQRMTLLPESCFLTLPAMILRSYPDPAPDRCPVPHPYRLNAHCYYPPGHSCKNKMKNKNKNSNINACTVICQSV